MSQQKKNLNPDGNIINHDIWGTNYPYINARHTVQNDFLFKIKRAVANINPFAYQQIPSQKRIALEVRNGNNFYVGQPYPNPVHWDKFFPTHYDPLGDATLKYAPHQVMKHGPMYATLALGTDSLPRGCVRQLQQYYRCELVNGDKKCNEEKNAIIQICPNWALDGMKENKRQLQKIEAIQTKQYRSVLQVADYNKGRSPKDVSDKTWVNGTREHLRPDTLWADERYANITQAEVNEAKKRHQERELKAKARAHSAEHGHGHGHGHGPSDILHEEHYDFKGSQFRVEKPLYP